MTHSIDSSHTHMHIPNEQMLRSTVKEIDIEKQTMHKDEQTTHTKQIHTTKRTKKSPIIKQRNSVFRLRLVRLIATVIPAHTGTNYSLADNTIHFLFHSLPY